jgi:uncharacterized phage-associated protein
MSWRFDPLRATQAAAFVVKCSGSNRMQYLKLLKILYFADRASLKEKGYPITGDQPYAMDYGPVLTRVYDYIKCNLRKGTDVWFRYFRTIGYDVECIEDPGTSRLSKYDRRIMVSVYEEHKDMDGFDMSRVSHDFPEWREKYRGEGTSTLIPIENTLNAIDVVIEDLPEKIEEERKFFGFFENLGGAIDNSSGRLLPN